ncbi:MAG TPA: methyltransferase [Sphingomonadaceae bacterium]|nr:methyltransferase [Sphingomonadaceae bacterium]
MSDDTQARYAPLVDMLAAGWRTRVLYEAVRHGLIDALGDTPQSGAALAQAHGLDADAVRRLLRALATLGICRQTDSDGFALTALGRGLRTDEPGSLRGVALHWGDRLWQSLGTIGDTLETGRPGMSTDPADFARMQADPERAAVFNRAMAEQSLVVGEAVARAYDFSGFKTIMDVGGGYGAMLAAILGRYPALTGWSFDMAVIEEAARAWLAERGLGARAGFRGGSFFEAVPAGADCLVLKYILHDWDDDHSRTILGHCRAALAPDGVVLIVERILPEIVGPADEAAVRGDIVMLTVGGRERTEREYRALLGATGLAVRAVIPAGEGFSIIEAVPA